MNKKILKKFIALTLAIVSLITLSIPTSAQEFADYEEQYREKTQYYKTIYVSQGFNNTGYCFQNQPYDSCSEYACGAGTCASGSRTEARQVIEWTGWSDWKNCEGGCPTGSSSRQIEKRKTFALKVDDNNGNSYAIYGEPGKEIDVTVPSKEGYTFTGWDYVGTGNFDSTTNKYIFDSSVSQLTAKYEINRYRVNLFYNGTTVVDDTFDYGTAFTTHSMDGTLIETYLNESGIDQEIVPPVVEGYNFATWNYDTADNSIKSNYTKKMFQVSFLDFEGKEIYKEEVAYKETPTAPIAPEVKGYTFTGWDKDFSSVESDLLISSKYEINIYPVEIRNDKAIVISEEMKHFSQVEILDKDENPIKKIEIVEPYQEDIAPLVYYGYDFVEYKVETDSNDNKLIIPNYDAKTWFVKFVGQDGSTVISTAQVVHNTNVKAPIPPKVYGYVFVGWDKPLTNIASDQTITAMYSDDPSVPRFNVTFTVNDENQKYGSLVLDNKQVYSLNINMVINGTKLADILPTYRAKENSKFQGFFVKDKKVDPSTYKIETIDEIELRFYPDYNNNDIDDRTENITVTWETNGGSTLDPTPVAMNSSLQEFPTPKKDGFTFEGWYTSSSFYQAWMKSDKFNKDMTLYAKWSITPDSSATVTWETNGGSTIADTVIAIGSKVAEPEKPNKQGATFEGWYISSGLSQKWYFSTKLEKDITLYAKWTSTSNPTPSPTPAPTVPEQHTNPYSGKTFVIRFVNSEDVLIEEVLLPFGHTIYIKNKDSEVLNEYAVRQSLVITLPEEPIYSDLKFSKWSEHYDETDYNSYVLQQKYLSNEPTSINEEDFNKPSSEESSLYWNLLNWNLLILYGISFCFLLTFYLLMRYKAKIQSRKLPEEENPKAKD